MQCKVEGCDRRADYKTQQVCQKHYFRFMRNGHYRLKGADRKTPEKRPKKFRVTTPNGYERIAIEDHPLSDKQGYVFEHRYVYYEEVNKNPVECEICGDDINWINLHIDHIDNDKSNNQKENLRALCRSCNVFLGHSAKSMGKVFLEFNGKKMTAHAWARQPGVSVSGTTIIRRKESGMSDFDAIFSPKITHKLSVPEKTPFKYDFVRGITERLQSGTDES